jgi:hypothetical protein
MRKHPIVAAISVAVALVALAVPIAASAATTPTPVVIRITVKNGKPVGGIQRPSVKKGKLVRIVVTTATGSGIHLHGYDLEKTVKKGTPTVLQFTAKLPGRFELELHPRDTLLAQLTVRP